MSDTRPTTLITGAAGEMGHALIPRLRRAGEDLVTLDLKPLPPDLREAVTECVEGSVADPAVVEPLFRRHRFRRIFHLAAILSSRAEEDPDLAHEVNVEGTRRLLRLAVEHARTRGCTVQFLFPSSIAVYGLPDAATKRRIPPVKETEWIFPRRIYGCNKVYCELLGNYLAERLEAEGRDGLDFRSIRFPGLISAETVPSGGTSDYIPEMVHAAAQGRPYRCFVSEDTRLPFMTMPDAVDAFVQLAGADRRRLRACVYNIQAFSLSAGEARERIIESFPDAEITFDPDPRRQAIVDTWPGEVDDRRAREDWGFEPRHDAEAAFHDYLLPALRRRYGRAPASPAGE